MVNMQFLNFDFHQCIVQPVFGEVLSGNHTNNLQVEACSVYMLVTTTHVNDVRLRQCETTYMYMYQDSVNQTLLMQTRTSVQT